MAVDEVVVRAVLRDELSRGLEHIERRVERLDKKMTTAGKASVGMGRSFGTLGKQAKAVDGSLRKMSMSLAQFSGQAVRTSAISLAALGTAATTFGLKSASSFEQSRIAFGTLLGSVEQGNSLFAGLQKFNLQTPFDLGQVSAATQTLLQFGFTGNNVMQTLKGIANVAATSGPAAGENLGRIALAVGQISSSGVLRAQDLNQLVQAGFPAYQLLTDITGQTTAEIRKQMESGLELPAQRFIDAINNGEGVLKRFAGGAQKQANTLSGVFSNLKDTTQTQLAEAFQPLSDTLVKTMPNLSTQVGAFINATAPGIANIAGLLVDLLTKALPILQPVVKALFDGLGRLFEAALPGLGAMAPVMDDLALAITEMATELVPVMPDLVDAFVALVGVLPEMVRLLTSFVPLISPLAGLVENLASMDGAAAGLLITLIGYRALSSVIGVVYGMAQALMALNMAQAGGVGAAGKGGRLGRVAKYGGAAGGAATGLGIAGISLSQEPSLMGDLGTVGGAALTGAMVGSVIPGVGTVAGAAVGGAIGVGGAVGRRWAGGGDAPQTRQVSSSTVIQPGGVLVQNPNANVDVIRAIEEYEARKARRQ